MQTANKTCTVSLYNPDTCILFPTFICQCTYYNSDVLSCGSGLCCCRFVPQTFQPHVTMYGCLCQAAKWDKRQSSPASNIIQLAEAEEEYHHNKVKLAALPAARAKPLVTHLFLFFYCWLSQAVPKKPETNLNNTCKSVMSLGSVNLL